MKVLWLVSQMFPPLCLKLGIKNSPFCGWLYSSAKILLETSKDITLGVIVPSGVVKTERYEIDNIIYYLVPKCGLTTYSHNNIQDCRKVIDDFCPNFIHIHGAENTYAIVACLADNGRHPIVVNIQGLANGCITYADGGLTFLDKMTNITVLDFYRGTFLFRLKHRMIERAKYERRVLKIASDVIGRTQWDHDHVMTINPNVHYHTLNETLRDSFYSNPTWDYNRCKKHSVFLSNSSEPLKGAHKFLYALTIVIKKYPDTIAYICGSSVMNNDFKTVLRFQGYHLYLRKLVMKLNLEKHVNFIGTLNELQMKQAFLNSNVYVLCSSIENSSNSLCEAQILGVPTVASYCGGTPSLVDDGKTGFLYRYEEVEMLAHRIIEIFEKQECLDLSDAEKNEAKKRHNRKANALGMIDIYKTIGSR